MAAAEDDSDVDELALLFADNESNKAIDALFIVAQHDGCRWAHDCRYVKDLCKATRAETGLWSAMVRVGYGQRKRTLLMFEAQRGRLDRVQWLLVRGAPRDARDSSGVTALLWASEDGHTEIVRALIAAEAGVDIAAYRGYTPLHRASLNGHTEIVRTLIAAGAGVNIADRSGWTPLHHASYHGHTETVRVLCDAGGISHRYREFGEAAS
jgi:hypothetical protein